MVVKICEFIFVFVAGTYFGAAGVYRVLRQELLAANANIMKEATAARQFVSEAKKAGVTLADKMYNDIRNTVFGSMSR